HSACDFHNRLIRNLLDIVAEKNIFITRKLQYLSKRTIRDKLISYLSDECKKQGEQDFTIPFNRQQLADYLIVDRSALSNELSKMFGEGIIDYHRNVFRLKKSFD
ncbi:MAG TPA: helix-turn-helix domain-containing protein, partial [Clostridia bacterium]|nr:helix-turn-helix domain-containing protein [Clostridia bacterium]